MSDDPEYGDPILKEFIYSILQESDETKREKSKRFVKEDDLYEPLKLESIYREKIRIS